MKIDIKHVAKLARLRIEENQLEEVERKLLSVIGMVENLPEITGTDSGLDPQNPMVLRPDVVTPSLPRAQVLANAPFQQSGCVVVPKTVE